MAHRIDDFWPLLFDEFAAHQLALVARQARADAAGEATEALHEGVRAQQTGPRESVAVRRALADAIHKAQ